MRRKCERCERSRRSTNTNKGMQKTAKDTEIFARTAKTIKQNTTGTINDTKNNAQKLSTYNILYKLLFKTNTYIVVQAYEEYPNGLRKKQRSVK